MGRIIKGLTYIIGLFLSLILALFCLVIFFIFNIILFKELGLIHRNSLEIIIMEILFYYSVIIGLIIFIIGLITFIYWLDKKVG